MNTKKIIAILFIFIITLISGAYLLFLFKLPQILTNAKNIQKYEHFIKNKTNIDTKIEGVKLDTRPNLSIILGVDNIDFNAKQKEQLANVKKLKYKVNLLNLKKGELSADNIFIDLENIKKYSQANTPKNTKFKFDNLPYINLKKGYIKINKNAFINLEYINTNKKNKYIITKLKANLNLPYTKTPIIIGGTGIIKYKNQLEFENFSITLNKSKLYFTGGLKDLNITASDLPADDISSTFLYFYKLKHPDKKNFLENFHNLTGKLDVNLNYKNGDFKGICITKDMKALFFDFKIPVSLPYTEFYFNKKNIKAETNGTFGAEPTYTSFNLDGLLTPNVIATGTVKSTFTNNITKHYYPDVEIVGIANAQVDYITKNETVDILYKLGLPKNNRLKYKGSGINHDDKNRIITMNTIKKGDFINIKKYDYSIQDEKKILYGNGEIKKNNGRYKLSQIALKTNGNIDIDILNSITDSYLKNKTFNADLLFHYDKKYVSGDINFYDISHSDFIYLNDLNLNTTKNKFKMQATGKFYNSPISLNIVGNNEFKSNIHINEANISLESFLVQKGKFSQIPKTSSKKVKKGFKRPEVIIDKGTINVGRIYSDKFNVKNVIINGKLVDNIVHFNIPQAKYANGVLGAKGLYDVINHSSDIQFFASDIDSNIVATNMFKLPEHIHGQAFATLHLKTKNKLNDINAKATFAMHNGYLPRLGSTEIKISKKKKTYRFTLEDATNIDFSKPDKYYSNLYGSFTIDNEGIKNAKIFSKSDYLSFFIEGNYNIEKQYGDLSIWGHSNKTASKKIRILKIPVNLIYKFVFHTEHTFEQYTEKIKLIPEIKAKITDKIATFRIRVKGNLNSKNLDVTLKNLK